MFQFRPVLANRPVMGYILAYSAHTWELFGLRSWMVAFLAVAAAAQASDQGLSPSHVATIASLLAMAASIAGAELAVRFERRLVCGLAALSSAMLAGIMGFFVQAPYQVVVALVLLHNILVQLDSAALTTGAVLETHSNRRGATIGLHSLLGFGAAFVGPLAFGMVLDLAASFGPMTAWGLAFATLAGVACLAPLALWRMRR